MSQQQVTPEMLLDVTARIREVADAAWVATDAKDGTPIVLTVVGRVAFIFSARFAEVAGVEETMEECAVRTAKAISAGLTAGIYSSVDGPELPDPDPADVEELRRAMAQAQQGAMARLQAMLEEFTNAQQGNGHGHQVIPGTASAPQVPVAALDSTPASHTGMYV